MVRPAGLEPTTLCLEGRCSIQLSYERTMSYVRISTVVLIFVLVATYGYKPQG